MQPSLLSYLRKLRNHEFAEAYELISSNLEIDELENDNVTQAAQAVVDYTSNLILLKNLKRQHPLTEQIDDLKKERHQYLLSMRGRALYCMKGPSADERSAAKCIIVWLSGYKEFFSGATIHDQSRLVGNLMGEYQSDLEIQEAITKLNLSQTFDSVTSTTQEIRLLHLNRLNQNKATSAKAKLVREVAFTHIQTLWKTLEVAAALKTLDGEICLAIFESINWVIISFKGKYLGKNTRRENEKLKAEQEGEQPEPEYEES